MAKKIVFPALAALLLGLASCTQETTTAQQSPFRITATIQDIMNSIVDPSADYIWESVAFISTESGVQDRRPQTDEEWAEVRRRAIALVEATNLLVMEGRRVVTEGKQLEDADIEGNLPPEEIQQAIDSSRETFVALAHGLQDTAVQALAAIDAKNVDALTEVGEKMDMACEACHMTYWYPNSQQPIQSRDAR